ncbi:MAG: histidine phosphatase family protein [Saprospiraceae bacterium]|nr:histidine phosphatase family protein [Saprospiraceae bacterium]
MKELYIIRHGETDFNRQGIIQGSGVNSSLNEVGKLQSLRFFNQYKNLDFDYVYTSNLKRTHESVQHFINQGITWRVRAEIREISWGIHEGQKERKKRLKNIKI